MISLDKKYRTRNGRDVRIYAVDGGGEYSVHGAIACDNGYKMTEWTSEGIFIVGQFNYNADLIEIKPRIKRTGWVNVYPGTLFGIVHQTKKEALELKGPGILACVKIEIDCEEGEGLEE